MYHEDHLWPTNSFFMVINVENIWSNRNRTDFLSNQGTGPVAAPSGTANPFRQVGDILPLQEHLTKGFRPRQPLVKEPSSLQPQKAVKLQRLQLTQLRQQ